MKRQMPIFSIEGGDGTGKTTVLMSLEEKLKAFRIDYMMTREPGGVPISELVRDIIHNPMHTEMDAKTEALLYAASRRQHLVQKVFPAVEAGKLVIFDRYVDSSVVYQGYVRGLGMETVYEINRFSTEDFLPDKTFVLDLEPKEAQKRIHRTGQREVNRLDNENMAFHEKVREGYLKLAKMNPQRIHIIDASPAVETVFNSLWSEIKNCLPETVF